MGICTLNAHLEGANVNWMEDQQEQWADWGRDEFKTALCEWLTFNGHAGNQDLDADEMDDDMADSLYHCMCEASGNYPESSGGNCTFPDYTNQAAFDAYIPQADALDAFTFSPVMMATTVQGDGREDETSVHHMEGDAHVHLTINECNDQPTAAPLGWINSASISAEADKDQIVVSVSVDDPRGAFCMTLRRKPDGTILVHLPHAGEGMPHAETVEIHPGTLAVAHTMPKGELQRALEGAK